MATSIEERSGTIKENEDAEEMQICDICGDAGYDGELAVCSRCNDSAEHIYCMATMHDRLPLRWVCEKCGLEEKKGSAKKRFAGNGPLSTQAYKRQNTNELSSCSALNEAKNILVQEPPSNSISHESRIDFPGIPSAIFTENIEPNLNSLSKKNSTGEVVASSSLRMDKRFSAVETQLNRGSNMSKILSSSLEGRPAVEACLSALEQGEAVVLSSPTLRGPSGCLKSLEKKIKLTSEIRTARESSIKGNADTAPKDASNRAKFSANGFFLDSKRVFSRSVSMKSVDDEPSFLLPSRPKNLIRSKSAVVRPSACWTSDKGHHNDLSNATHEPARRGTSCIMDCTKSTSSGPRPYRQSGEGRNTECERSSKSSCLWGHNIDSGKETNNRSPRSSDSFQQWGSNDKESRRCYRCGELGHIAVRCKNMISSKPWEWESSRGPASAEKSMAVRQSTPESPLGLRSNKEEGSLKESSSWKLHGADSSGTCSKPSSNTCQLIKDSPKERASRIDTVTLNKESSSGTCSKPSSNKQIKSSGKERLGRIDTVNSKKEEGNIKESSSWKLHGADSSGTCSKPSSNASQQIKNSGKEWLGRTDIVNMAVKLSHKSSENAERQVAQVQVLDGEKGNVVISSAPSISFETGKQVSIQSIATSQQTQGVVAVMDKHLQEPQPNQMVLSHLQNRCGSGTLTSTADLVLAVDTSFDSCCEIRADPCVEMLWSGCFNVCSNNCLTTYNGLQAHPSTKADPRVFEAIKTLPFELYLEESKRGLETDTWPRSLQEQPPTSNSIGVYFFPVDMECHDIWYKPLLDHLSSNDLALKTNLDLFQLLIFPSQLLPQGEQCWEDRQYLWGILRKGTSFKSSSTAMVGDAL